MRASSREAPAVQPWGGPKDGAVSQRRGACNRSKELVQTGNQEPQKQNPRPLNKGGDSVHFTLPGAMETRRTPRRGTHVS